ncbi:MAG: hypothetical protein K8M05_28955 [Deltaproteobacteria bacterium]|nr:hypothetical protein [Kofleriaceae bacterium]
MALRQAARELVVGQGAVRLAKTTELVVEQLDVLGDPIASRLVAGLGQDAGVVVEEELDRGALPRDVELIVVPRGLRVDLRVDHEAPDLIDAATERIGHPRHEPAVLAIVERAVDPAPLVVAHEVLERATHRRRRHRLERTLDEPRLVRRRAVPIHPECFRRHRLLGLRAAERGDHHAPVGLDIHDRFERHASATMLREGALDDDHRRPGRRAPWRVSLREPDRSHRIVIAARG